MTVTDLNEARRRRDERANRAREIAQWVRDNAPFSQPWYDWPPFHERWPGLTQDELVAVHADLQGMQRRLQDRSFLIDFVANLTGRYEMWSRAANWMVRHEHIVDPTDPEFLRLFGHLSYSELLLSVMERERRVTLQRQARDQ